MKYYDKLLRSIVGLFLLGITSLVTAQVVFRFILGNPLSWPEEMGRLIFIYLVFIGGALASLHKEHISIEVLDTVIRKHKKLEHVIEIVRELLLIIVMVITFVGGLQVYPLANRIALSATGLPKSLMTLAVIIGSLLILIESVRQLRIRIVKLVRFDSTQE